MSSHQRIISLAKQFPVLRAAVVDDWQPAALDEWAAGGASDGERHAVAFILHVWDCHHVWNVGRFDVMDALATWDEKNRSAFVEWAAAPFWM